MLFLRGYTLKRVVVKAGDQQEPTKDVEAQEPAAAATEPSEGRDDEVTIESGHGNENENTNEKDSEGDRTSAA